MTDHTPSRAYAAIDALLAQHGDRGADWKEKPAEYHLEHLEQHIADLDKRCGWEASDADSGKRIVDHIATRAAMLCHVVHEYYVSGPNPYQPKTPTNDSDIRAKLAALTVANKRLEADLATARKIAEQYRVERDEARRSVAKAEWKRDEAVRCHARACETRERLRRELNEYWDRAERLQREADRVRELYTRASPK